MKELTIEQVEQVSGGEPDGWTFGGYALTIGAATLAVVAAPAVGAIAGVLTIGAVGAYAMSSYSSGGSGRVNAPMIQ